MACEGARDTMGLQEYCKAKGAAGATKINLVHPTTPLLIGFIPITSVSYSPGPS